MLNLGVEEEELPELQAMVSEAQFVESASSVLRKKNQLS